MPILFFRICLYPSGDDRHMTFENRSEEHVPVDAVTSNPSLLPDMSEYRHLFSSRRPSHESTTSLSLDFSSNIYGDSETVHSEDAQGKASDLMNDSLKTENFDKTASLMTDKVKGSDDSHFRSNFKDPDAAAKAAFKEMYASSQLQTSEYGARIYYDPKTKTYGYSLPERYPMEGEAGYQDNFDPQTHAPIGEVPSGMIPVARLHTHVQANKTAHGYGAIDPDRREVSAKMLSKDDGDQFNPDPNRFSPPDLVNAKREHVFSYLATPDGSILRYDPNTNKVSPAGSVEK